MPSHTAHAPIREAGLSDECARCGEIAEDPVVWLDDENLRALLDRTFACLNDGDGSTARSNLERKAMDEVEKTLVRVAHIARANPGALVAYLRDRWRIEL